MRVGIDVGGTHTDAVVVHGEQVIASHKAVTSMDITGGILHALRAVLDTVGPERDRIDAVMLGTTQFTNAVVQRRQLSEAAVIRLGLPSGECLPPMVDWPEDLARALGNHGYMVRGGNEFDGGQISPLDGTELEAVFARIAGTDARAVAISSVFSPLSPQMEIAAGKLLKAKMPEMPVVLSHELGAAGPAGTRECRVAERLAAAPFGTGRRRIRGSAVRLRHGGAVLCQSERRHGHAFAQGAQLSGIDVLFRPDQLHARGGSSVRNRQRHGGGRGRHDHRCRYAD